MASLPCIYCLRSDRPSSIEHILPQGLIGVEEVVEEGDDETTTREFVLAKGEVCRECNGTVGLLDERLQREVGVLRVFWNGIGTKRGTPATASRPGLFAIRRTDGPAVFINTEKYVVETDDGIRISPSNGKANSVGGFDIEFDDQEKPKSVRYSQPIFVGKQFIRAVYKIAFETLCFNRGSEKVLDPRYNGIRQYILRGRGTRLVGVPRRLDEIPSDDIFGAPRVEIQRIRHSLDYMSKVRLGVTFHIDLTPDHSVQWGPAVVSVSEKHKLTLHLRSRMEFPPPSALPTATCSACADQCTPVAES